MRLVNQSKSKIQPRHRKGTIRPEPIADIGSVLENDVSVGEEIRQLRKASSLTLGQLAEASNLSKGYLSQIERGISSPSIKALHSISRALGVNISWFFKSPPEGENQLAEFVVRKGNRRSLTFDSGITDELLSPNLARGMELLRCKFEPHAESGPEAYEHRGEETGIVISGELTLWLDGQRIALKEGDSFAFESTMPHKYANESEEEAVVIWAISPPSY